MWFNLGQFILKNRLFLLIFLITSTIILGYYASKIELSYELNKAIPTDNKYFKQYQDFKNRFGDDGGLMMLGFEKKDFYAEKYFNSIATLCKEIKNAEAVEQILSIPSALVLVKNDSINKLEAKRIFEEGFLTQTKIDSGKAIFENLPFYKSVLYNPETNSYLIGITLNKDSINSKARTRIVNNLLTIIQKFEKNTQTNFHISGLPFIRTTIANRIAEEMKWLLFVSLALSAFTLLLFFRSFSAMTMSLLVVVMGVIWSLATMVLLGYKITLLNALIPPLIVVIGIPNCIYFLNKYHLVYKENNNKNQALINMVGKMGVVTLFCNIAAAIGFAVFALTQSALLREFGIVAGINIMALFFISLIFIPAVLSYLPVPKKHQLRYLENKILTRFLEMIERWTLHHKKIVYTISIVFSLIAFAGIYHLKNKGFIVDDLPKTDKVYSDLKWFENNFKGIMPLEIMVDGKKKNGIITSMENMLDIEELSFILSGMPQTAKPLSLIDGLKFANQAYFDGDSLSYAIPADLVMPLIASYLKSNPDQSAQEKTGFSKLMNSFIDSTKQYARISVNMKDIGTEQLPIFLDSVQKITQKIFDPKDATVTLTGASITFLEGSRFIIKGLEDSIFWALLLIAIAMLYLFKSVRVLVCSLIPNIIPLIITAGLMGWVGVPLKPSTVLVFSIALGISIDITIRFLINYKQELPHYNYNTQATIIQTIRQTGISIIYTSLVLIAGFVIFCFSGFGGTQALGWLTSLTLFISTLANLSLLPVLLSSLKERKNDNGE
jgi:predicted RND superfamily exporter protein